MTTILGVSGSLRAGSYNTSLLQAATAMVESLPGTARITPFTGLGELPLFNPDLDAAGEPAAVKRWRQALRAADGVLIFTPEYAHGVPGALKNALDWVVGSGEFVDKPTVLISASTSLDGGHHAHAAVLRTLVVMSAQMVAGTSLCISSVRAKLNDERCLIDQGTQAQLRGVLQALVAACTAFTSV